MKKITSNDLANLLNIGFDGKIEFCGRVFVRHFVHGSSRHFFKADGGFTLKQEECDKQMRKSYLLLYCKSGLNFLPTTGDGPIKSYNRPGYGDVIAFPIEMAPDAVLQIEPDQDSIWY